MFTKYKEKYERSKMLHPGILKFWRFRSMFVFKVIPNKDHQKITLNSVEKAH